MTKVEQVELKELNEKKQKEKDELDEKKQKVKEIIQRNIEIKRKKIK